VIYLIRSASQAHVLLPGLATPLAAGDMEYTAYLFEALPLRAAMADMRAQGQPLLSTLCGLEAAAAALDPLHWRRSRAVLRAFEQGADLMTHSFEGLRAGTEYSVVLAAVCSGECLRQLSKVTALPPQVTTSCSDSTSSCRAQSLVFAQVHTPYVNYIFI
jgi:hypothetical protein